MGSYRGDLPAMDDALLRPRLLQQLLARFDHRLTVLEAPAGYGKTTALAQAVAENRLTPRGTDVWLACQPADVKPSTLVDALLVVLGHDGRLVDDQLSDGVELVCEAVWSRAPTDVAIVIDDAHLLGDE